MNDKNLIPMSQRSLEERQEIGRQGGIKSGRSQTEEKADQRDRENACFYDNTAEKVIAVCPHICYNKDRTKRSTPARAGSCKAWE